MKDEKQGSEMGFQRIFALASCVCEYYMGPNRKQDRTEKAQSTRVKTKKAKRVRTRESKSY